MLRETPGRPRVVVVGAGIGGLTAAMLLAAAGCRVSVIEAQDRPGGKLRAPLVAGRPVDSGPTVMTLKPVFDAVLARLGTRLADHLTLERQEILARHHWPDGSTLDLFSDIQRSAAAVEAFGGAKAADGYLAFTAAATEVHRTLAGSFIDAETVSPIGLARAAGLRGLPALTRIRPFSSMWQVIGRHIDDPRLHQLFGRYATYCGASPFSAPGPLTMIADVERAGVWRIAEGMVALADLFARLGESRGVRFHFGSRVERIETSNGRVSAAVTTDGRRFAADAIVFNGDPSALGAGLLGSEIRNAAKVVERPARSLSAFTLSMVADAGKFPLVHHNVFFSADYAGEFNDILGARRLPADPTVYLCASDRHGDGLALAAGPERLFTITNAAADGDLDAPTEREIDQWTQTTLGRLTASGLTLDRQATTVTTPADFAAMFPATGGALYGRAQAGWAASFQRPTARTRVKGLYLAGGAVHPGPGLPMATLSGRNAAAVLCRDFASTLPSPLTAIDGGISTR